MPFEDRTFAQQSSFSLSHSIGVVRLTCSRILSQFSRRIVESEFDLSFRMQPFIAKAERHKKARLRVTQAGG